MSLNLSIRFADGETRRFRAQGDEESLLILKAAGWLYLPSKAYAMTTQIARVTPFAEYCTGPSAEFVAKYLEKRRAAVQASISATDDMEIPAPPGLEYRGYQRAGIAFMADRYASLNADVPRLGKTIQTIGVTNLLPQRKKPYRFLVEGPSNAKPGWVREFKKWTVHDLSVGRFEGNENPETDVCVINWEIMHRHAEYLASVDWDVVAVDEAHKLGNSKAIRTKLAFGKKVKGLKGRINAKTHFITLSGTPVFTRTLQLFPLIQKLDPQGLGADWFRFTKRYCDAKPTRFGMDNTGFSNVEELQYEMRKAFMVRREKADVLDELPPMRRTVFLPKTGLSRLLDQERSAFQKNLDKLRELISNGAPDSELAKETLLPDAGEVKGKGSAARQELALRKVPMVKTFVDELLEQDMKVIVFYHHRDPLQKFYDSYPPEMIARIWGGMSTSQRENERVRFQEDDTCRIIVGNLQSMSEAIELSAGDATVFAEFSRAVPSEYDQAEERSWLPTKEIPVEVYRLVIEDSIEADLVEILDQRQAEIERMSSKKYLF